MLILFYSISVAESHVLLTLPCATLKFSTLCVSESIAYMFWLKVPIGTLTLVHVNRIHFRGDLRH